MVMKGDKVIAILDTNDDTKTVRCFGEGVYEGDVPVPDSMGIPGIKNPRIDLGQGKCVWGYECWWGASERMRARWPAPEWTWADVDIDTYRQARGR